MATMKTIARALLLFGCSSAGRGHITPERGLSRGLLEEDLSCIGCELNSKGSASDLPGTAPLALMMEVMIAGSLGGGTATAALSAPCISSLDPIQAARCTPTAASTDCRVNGSNLCKSCNDGWEKDTIDVPGTCYFPSDFCDDPKFHESDEELGTCYSEIAHTVGRGEVSVTKEWSGTDTTSWEVCRDVGSEVEVCAETSFVIPKVFLPLELGLCSAGTVSIDLCSSETRELAQTQSTSLILQGIVAHSVFACLKGRHYVVEDEGNATFVTYRKNFYLFCARPAGDRRGGCPGVPCAGLEVHRPDLEPDWPEIPNAARSGRQAAGLVLVAAGAAAAAA